MEEMSALRPPRDDAEMINDYLSTGSEAIARLDDLADAYESQDQEQIAALESEIQSTTNKANGLVQGYGFEVCASQ